MRACIGDRRGPQHASLRKDVEAAPVTRAQPSIRVQPLATAEQLLHTAYDHAQDTYRLRLRVDMGVTDRAPALPQA